jgi:hypothetical protein
MRTGQIDLFGEVRSQPPPKPPKPAYDPWIAIYARGKEVLGRSSGGQITLLRKFYDDKPSKVMAKIEDAAEHRVPVTWLAAWLWSVHDPEGKLSGETIPGGWDANE